MRATDAVMGVGGIGGAQLSPSQLPLDQTSCPRRTTLITYYSNTPDHDSLRNPYWPVAATTEDQNRHKMAPVPESLVWPAPGADPRTLFNARPWEPVPICRELYSRLANIVNRPEFAVETFKTDSTSNDVVTNQSVFMSSSSLSQEIYPSKLDQQWFQNMCPFVVL